MSDLDGKEKREALARALLQRIMARMHDAPERHRKDNVQDIRDCLAIAEDAAADKINDAFKCGRREENEACATIAHNETVEGGSGKTEVVFHKIRARMEDK